MNSAIPNFYHVAFANPEWKLWGCGVDKTFPDIRKLCVYLRAAELGHQVQNLDILPKQWQEFSTKY